ncbi:hypothetical protein ACJIZ3_014606 [Penstemon smallii]|uniref:Uncharacterized protein n=1 Tax=Penstemon smallii TaxID=265156 RepID=A0ABD3RKB9_9LAMI
MNLFRFYHHTIYILTSTSSSSDDSDLKTFGGDSDSGSGSGSGRISRTSTCHKIQSRCLCGISCVIEFLHGGDDES